MPSRPAMMPPVGKSGPWIRVQSSSTETRGLSMMAQVAAMISCRLCGGMLVAMPTAMPVAHEPSLREGDEGVVTGGVAVGVVVLKVFVGDAGALVEGAIVQEAFTQHGVKDAARHGFQAIAGVGEGAGDDDRHRVFDVGR